MNVSREVGKVVAVDNLARPAVPSHRDGMGVKVNDRRLLRVVVKYDVQAVRPPDFAKGKIAKVTFPVRSFCEAVELQRNSSEVGRACQKARNAADIARRSLAEKETCWYRSPLRHGFLVDIFGDIDPRAL